MRKLGINLFTAIAILFFTLGSIGSESKSSRVSDDVSATSLDIDGNDEFDALTDGLLILRSMFGLSDSPLVSGAISENAVYEAPEEIQYRISSLGDRLDVDNDGNIDALTDGLIILRYLFGLTGDPLVNGVVGIDAQRKTASELEAHMELLTRLGNAPVITSDAEFLVYEGTEYIGEVTASDLDGDYLVYSVSGSELEILAEEGTLSFFNSPDYEKKSIYSETVTVSDGEFSSTQDITVTVLASLGNRPVITSSADFTVSEGSGKYIGEVTASDLDGDYLVYSVSGSELEILAEEGELSFRNYPDYETKSLYSATITVSDGSLSSTQDITVSVLNENEPGEYVVADSARSDKPDLPPVDDSTFNVSWTPSKYNECSVNTNVSPSIEKMTYGLGRPSNRFGDVSYFEPSIIFADEAFTVMVKTQAQSDGGSKPLSEITEDYGVFGVANPKVYDDGTHGDVKPNDSIYTRACVYSKGIEGPGRNFNVYDSKLVVLQASLRGSEQALTDLDVGVRANDTGTFYSLGDRYNINYRDLTINLNFGFCFHCQYAWHLYGNQFDIMMTIPRSFWSGSGMNGLAQWTSGVGFNPPYENYRYKKISEARDYKFHQEVLSVAIINTPYMNGITHEIAHGLYGYNGGSDYPDTSYLWNSGDSNHIDGDVVIDGPLTGPWKNSDLSRSFVTSAGKGARPYVNSEGEFKIKEYDITEERASDLILYMMGLKTLEEATGKSYKLVNSSCENASVDGDKIICPNDNVIYDQAIMMDAQGLVDRYGPWGTNGITSYDPKSIDLGVMYTSDRNHTEAEITHLSRQMRSYITSDSSIPKIENGESITWAYATQGLSKINVDFRDSLLPIVSKERGTVSPLPTGFTKWTESSHSITDSSKDVLFTHFSLREGFGDDDDSQQYCIAEYSGKIIKHDDDYLYLESLSANSIYILSRDNASTNNWVLSDSVFNGAVNLKSDSFSLSSGSNNFIKVRKVGRYSAWPQDSQNGKMRIDISNDETSIDGSGCLKDLEFAISPWSWTGDNTAGYLANQRAGKHQGLTWMSKSDYTDSANNDRIHVTSSGAQTTLFDGDFDSGMDKSHYKGTMNIDDVIKTSSSFPDGLNFEYTTADNFTVNGVATTILKDNIFIVGEDGPSNTNDRTLFGIGKTDGRGIMRIYDVKNHDMILAID